MIKILVDPIIFSLQKKGGISKLMYHLNKSLKKDFDLIETNSSVFKSYFSKLSLLLPLNIKRYNTSVFFTSYLSYPLFNYSGAYVYVVHDCMNEFFASKLKSIYIRFLNRMCLRRATGIIYVSKCTKIDYESIYPKSKSISSIIIPNPLFSNITKKNNFSHNNFLLYIGNRKVIYKNFSLSIKIAKELGIELRIIGGGKLTRKELSLLNLTNVHYYYMGYVTDEIIEKNYFNATALIYPSRYEGFGLPIIEAQAFGCPVITCANSKGVNETSSNSTIEIDQNPTSEDIKKMKLLIDSPDYRSEICMKGYENIKKYNYLKTYTKYKNFLINQHDIVNSSNI